MNRTILDSDTLSAIMRQNVRAIAKAKQYLRIYPRLAISIMTRYEILRGLAAKEATTQIADFDLLCQSLEVFSLSDAIVVRGADLYGHLRRTGKPIGDGDVLIAATCLEEGYEIATNDVAHFSRVPRLVVHNWLD